MSGDALLLLFNAHDGDLAFNVPTVPEGLRWRRLIETRFSEEGPECFLAFGESYPMAARSFVLLLAEMEGEDHILSEAIRPVLSSM